MSAVQYGGTDDELPDQRHPFVRDFARAVSSELAHPACPMDDPLTAAIAQVQDEAAAREAGACTEIPEAEWQRVQREAAEAVSLPGWFWWALPVALAGVAVYGFLEMAGVLR